MQAFSCVGCWFVSVFHHFTRVCLLFVVCRCLSDLRSHLQFHLHFDLHFGVMLLLFVVWICVGLVIFGLDGCTFNER